MKYNTELIDKILTEFKNGKNKKQLEREYGVPRTTIIYWIKNENKIDYRKTPDKSLNYVVEEIKSNNKLYNYILGLYLGDGCVTENKMSYKLRISQDKKYEKIIDNIKESLSGFFNKNVTVFDQEGCSNVTICDKNLPLYFPQHGIGKKHDREIKLEDYQIENIDYENLMRGLWITDGSYYLAQKKYENYNFTNKSADIISIFEECLINLEIKYRKRLKINGIWIVEITKKEEVDKMKKIVGTKNFPVFDSDFGAPGRS